MVRKFKKKINHATFLDSFSGLLFNIYLDILFTLYNSLKMIHTSVYLPIGMLAQKAEENSEFQCDLNM